MFTTALYSLKSPQNLGMIARTHTAFGGDLIVDIVDGDKPWTWNQRSVYWSRGLHKHVELKSFTDFGAFVKWAHEERNQQVVAVEIAENSTMLPDFQFPDHPILLLGNETVGIPREMLAMCDHVVTVPLFGQVVGSLNVSNAAAVVMYEAVRSKTAQCRPIDGNVFACPQGSSMEVRKKLIYPKSSSKSSKSKSSSSSSSSSSDPSQEEDEREEEVEEEDDDDGDLETDFLYQ